MKINRGREPGTTSELRTATFTGEVWGDPVLAETDGVLINNVFFAPGARTHWHTHDQGQILVVTSGEGRARARDGSGGKLTAGDVVWIPPGEEHWHGAAPAATCSTWRSRSAATTGSTRSPTRSTRRRRHSPRADELRDAFVELHGHWGPAWQALRDADPGFFETYLELSAAPARAAPSTRR